MKVTKTPILGQEALKIRVNINNPLSALNARKSPKAPGFVWVEEYDGDVKF